jgi:GNAT superfamily N-acetyltransferase
MFLENYRFEKGNFFVSTDKNLLDFDVIHGYLKRSYWSENIPLEIVKNAAKHSITFGIYTYENAQVGYCRVVSDQSTFAYLCDVFVLEEYRGLGLSKFLMECIMGLPEFQNLRGWFLATNDAHGLYRQFGFDAPKFPEKLMQISKPDIYKNLTKGE